MKNVIVIAIFALFASCESSTQTAIRKNQPPAIAYVVAAQTGHALPAVVIIKEDE